MVSAFYLFSSFPSNRTISTLLSQLSLSLYGFQLSLSYLPFSLGEPAFSYSLPLTLTEPSLLSFPKHSLSLYGLHILFLLFPSNRTISALISQLSLFSFPLYFTTGHIPHFPLPLVSTFSSLTFPTNNRNIFLLFSSFHSKSKISHFFFLLYPFHFHFRSLSHLFYHLSLLLSPLSQITLFFLLLSSNRIIARYILLSLLLVLFFIFLFLSLLNYHLSMFSSLPSQPSFFSQRTISSSLFNFLFLFISLLYHRLSLFLSLPSPQSLSSIS